VALRLVRREVWREMTGTRKSDSDGLPLMGRSGSRDQVVTFALAVLIAVAIVVALNVLFIVVGGN
jgi:hypothetical protein